MVVTDERRSPIRRWIEWGRLIAAVRRRYNLFYNGRRRLHLWPPRAFSDKVSWRRLFDNPPLFAIFSDKLATRDFIEKHGFGAYLTPLLWVGDDAEQIPFQTLTPPYVIKKSCASAQYAIVTEPDADRPAIIAEVQGWLDDDYGRRCIEPGYLGLPRRIIIERFIGRPDDPPLEVRLFVFDGTCKVVQLLDIEPDRSQCVSYFTKEFELHPWKTKSPNIKTPVPRPTRLDDMSDIAETLGAGLDHLRVDFYVDGDTLHIGELTIYSWGGCADFDPISFDDDLGRFWTIDRPIRRALTRIAFHRWGDAIQITPSHDPHRASPSRV